MKSQLKSQWDQQEYKIRNGLSDQANLVDEIIILTYSGYMLG